MADELAFLRPAHAVDFLGDIFDICLREVPRPQQFGLLAAPGKEIAIVKRALLGHCGEKIPALRGRVH